MNPTSLQPPGERGRRNTNKHISVVAALLLCLPSSAVAQCPSSSFRDPESPGVSLPTHAVASQSQADALIFPPAFYLPSNNSLRVVLPTQPFVDVVAANTQTNCPHLQSNLANFHDPSIWSDGIVPGALPNTDITIPSNTKVLLSSCSLPSNITLGTITIPFGSSLIFADANITLHIRGFVVAGSLQLGSSTCRLASFINVTFHGTRPNATSLAAGFPSAEVKGMIVTGTFDAHSVQYSPTWARLAATAKVNSSVLYLQAGAVSWEIGQQILITTTTIKDSRDWHENEVKTISQIFKLPDYDVTAVVVSTPLRYNHYGGREYQAEVGLLSRRMVFQGHQNDSEPTDMLPIACNDTLYSSYPCANSSLTG
jgi:hypothetical protein